MPAKPMHFILYNDLATDTNHIFNKELHGMLLAGIKDSGISKEYTLNTDLNNWALL
jgi:hypothetical protein